MDNIYKVKDKVFVELSLIDENLIDVMPTISGDWIIKKINSPMNYDLLYFYNPEYVSILYNPKNYLINNTKYFKISNKKENLDKMKSSNKLICNNLGIQLNKLIKEIHLTQYFGKVVGMFFVS